MNDGVVLAGVGHLSILDGFLKLSVEKVTKLGNKDTNTAPCPQLDPATLSECYSSLDMIHRELGAEEQKPVQRNLGIIERSWLNGKNETLIRKN